MANEPRESVSPKESVEVMRIDPNNPPSAVPQEEPEGIRPDPQPAGPPKASPSAEDLPPVESVIAKQAAEEGLSIVDAERDSGFLYLIIEGGHIEDVQGSMARKLAYDARFHYGFESAGIEPWAGAEPMPKGKYRQTYRLTRNV